ncbi:MAG: PQQ-dependent sugar dehydrogenase [Myxococcota bacterium]
MFRSTINSFMFIASIGSILATLAFPASAQYTLRRVVSGLDRPVFATAPPRDFERIFIVDAHRGEIRILRLADGVLVSEPFLTLPSVSTGFEQGLLGLAFHPNYDANGFLYVYLTDPDTRIVRYSTSDDPDVADPLSATPILGWSQPQDNHNGGWIAFGPDGLLYVGSGDGGGSDDDDAGHTDGTGNAQDLTDNLLGKLLRIDVDGDDFPLDAQRNYAVPPDNPFVATSGDDEIWAHGLRNPWRAAFDRETGDLYVGDVGEAACEEIDVQPAASAGGENYGWRLREGTLATQTGGVGGPRPTGAIDPIFDYPHSGSTCSAPPSGFAGISVTGGYVYRGPITPLVGRYFFADFGTARIWSLVWDGSSPATFDGTNYFDLVDHGDDPRFRPDVGTVDQITSFGEDAAGNLYLLDLDGDVFVVPEAAACASIAAGALGLALLDRSRRNRRDRASNMPLQSAPSGGERGRSDRRARTPSADSTGGSIR